MSSYIWRVTEGINGLGKRTQTSNIQVIEFTASNITDGKHIINNNLNFIIGFAENERPGAFNEIQDTGPESLTYTISGSIETPNSNDIQQITKEWLIEDKQTHPFTKGMFGLELDNFGTTYNCIPTETGTTSPTRAEQARGLVLTNWEWVQDSETLAKLSFVATLRFSGDEGISTTDPKYNWSAIY